MSDVRRNRFSWGRLRDENEEEVAPKRISTPAGLRLSSIINTESNKNATESPSFSSRFSNPSFSPRLSLNTKRWSGIRVVEPDSAEAPVEEQKSKFREELNSVHGVSVPASALASPGYAGSLSEKSDRLLPNQQGVDQRKSRSRASRRRIILGLILLFLILLGIVIGLAVGLSRKKHKSSNPSSSPSQGNGTSSSQPSPTSTSVAKPSGAVPSNFPLGAYSFQTFLDMPITDCVTVASAWSCPPNTSGPDNPKSLATFPFTITGSSGSYKLESTSNSNAFGNITTGPIGLTLVDAGKSTENYRFRVFLDKKVSTTVNGVAAVCTYSSTTIQGNLYTKMSSSYPLAGQQVSNSAGSQWPFAFKLEQTAGPSEGSPQCVSTTGAAIAGSIASQSAESLCSCIYRNFKT